jgi:hypothetical protein
VWVYTLTSLYIKKVGALSVGNADFGGFFVFGLLLVVFCVVLKIFCFWHVIGVRGEGVCCFFVVF